MRVTVSADPEREELFVLVEGVITYEEVREHILRERDADALGFRELIDARAASVAITVAEVRELVVLLRFAARERRLGPTAVVVTSDDAFGMLRMIELLLDDVAAVRPFRDFAEAVDWLATAPARGRDPGVSPTRWH